MSRLRGVLFTDLDGTLLDFESYRPSAEALATLDMLKRVHILTVPATSKTADEVWPLLEELGLAGPAVVEGGAVVMHADGSKDVDGPPRSALVEVLARLAGDGWPIRGMSEMSVGEVVRITGLDDTGARRALNRLASEPFVTTRTLSTAEIAKLETAVAKRGAGLVRGGRFWHLMGAGVDKASGMDRALQAIGEVGILTAAIGDAWNDLPMLAAADLGFLLGERVERSVTPGGVVRLPVCGPAGFALAARRILARINHEAS